MKLWSFIPIVLMVLLTPWTPWLDMTLTRHVYESTHFSSDAVFDFIYDYGRLPAVMLFLAALGLLVASYCMSSLRKWRPAALALTVVMILGPGLVVNALLKDHWGRPRPKQTIEFGGKQLFRPYYKPNFTKQPEPSKSFPCGHCSMGFYFFALALVGKRYGIRSVFYGGMILAFTVGGALSVARIMQGGHYLSDILMSALIMWITALCVDWFIFGKATFNPVK